jgi:tRNA modification GTPase
VTPIPGTTRDLIKEELEIEGIPFRVIDTAGLRHPKDVVEQIGVERSLEAAKGADLILFVVDISKPLTKEDYEIAERIKTKMKKRNYLLLLNKIDLEYAFSKEEAISKLGAVSENTLEISAESGEGIDALKKQMVEWVWGGKLEMREDVFLLNIRERDLLVRAGKAIDQALLSLDEDATLDLIAVDIKEALDTLGELTGENLTEEVIDRIFSNFCIGK